MKIQRFEGKDAVEALRHAHMALGPNAVVLQTRTLRGSGLLGLSNGRRVEVTAAVDASADEPEHQEPSDVLAEAPTGLRQELAMLRNEIGHLRSCVSRTNDLGGPSGEFMRRVRDHLVTRTIEFRDTGTSVVALVGPTGVGKTTTLAKIAAAARVEGKRTAFITIDTYRIGAVQQLETYARLLEAPLSVTYCPEDVRSAVRKYNGYDLVLMDTVGRAAGNTAQIADQSAMLTEANPDEIHLCLDAGKSPAVLAAVLAGFGVLHPTHLLLTKLDEAAGIQDVLEAVLGAGMPVSYVTTGQRVPEDFDAADAVVLAGMLEG